MQENVIEFFTDQAIATLSLTQKRFINKIEKLSKKYPDECEIIAKNKDGSVCAHVPVEWVRIIRPRTISDETRAKWSDNMNQLNANSASKCNRKTNSEQRDT